MNGISENRHQRYFWVHPYTMTLYWSMDNPALDTRSNGKSKSIAIVSVTSVEDGNPLPPGLYHRSIIVQSPERSIKISCLNRQRHNIWLMSLQYLLKRSVESSRDSANTEETDSIGDYLESPRHTRSRNPSYNSGPFQSPQKSVNRMSTIRNSIAPDLNSTRTSVRQKHHSMATMRHRNTALGPGRHASMINPNTPQYGPEDIGKTPNSGLESYANRHLV